MNGKLLKCASCKDRDALLTFYDFPAEPPAISELAKLAEAHFVIVDRPENFLYVDPLTEFHKRNHAIRTA